MQEIWEKGELGYNRKCSFIQSIEKLVTSVEVFMDILVSCEPVLPEELLSPKIIYLHFSGIVDAIRNSLKENLKKERLTNVRLAESLALITEENQVDIEQLLPKLSYLKAGNPHEIFTAKMISEAITHLEKDGFDTTGLKAVVGKMQTDSKFENDNAAS